jgi:PAS domain S-box-containing protein
MVCLVWWLFTSAWENSVLDRSGKILASEFQYLSITTIAPLFLLFSLGFTGRLKKLTVFLRAALWVPALVIVPLAFTNSRHGLIWPTITAVSDDPGARLIYTRGPAVWANLVCAYPLILLGTIFLITAALRTRGIFRRQTVWLIPGAVAPWAANALYVFRIGPPGLDLPPFAFALSGLFVALSLFRYRFLNIVPAAHQAVIRDMSDAIIVLDDQGCLVDFNPAAQRLLGDPGESLGKPLEAVLAPWPEFAARVPRMLASLGADVVLFPAAGTWLDVRISHLRDSGDRVAGYLVVLRDVTEARRTEKERAAAQDRIGRQQQAVIKLAVSPASVRGDLAQAAAEATELAAQALGVERVSLWLESAEADRIECLDLYALSTGEHTRGAVLLRDSIPRYFDALHRGRVIDAPEALTDPRTRDLVDKYLRPLGISSVLDAPIRVAGKPVGLISIEQVGPPRVWLPDELRFAGEVADAMALAYSSMERRLTDEARLESEELFRIMVEAAPEAIFVQVAGAFAYLNAAAVRLFGGESPQQILGRHVLERIHPDFRADVGERIRGLNEEKKAAPALKEIYLKLDGSFVDVEVTAVPVKYHDLDGALVFARDVTERERAGENLRET